MYYQYVKAPPKQPLSIRAFLPFVSIGLGVLMLIWVGYPILSFRMRFAHLYANDTSVISPLAQSGSVLNAQHTTEANTGVSKIDYTKAYNWFPQSPPKKTNSMVDGYTISIQALNISNAYVTIGGDDLSKSLIHYGGTSAPGEYGNAVVFGHSVLPQFYNPTDYSAIFSTLPTLDTGDEIHVTYDGVLYTYEVESMRVTTPEDVSGLEQRYDNSYLTLVTCVPPGLKTKRLWVTARLKTT